MECSPYGTSPAKQSPHNAPLPGNSVMVGRIPDDPLGFVGLSNALLQWPGHRQGVTGRARIPPLPPPCSPRAPSPCPLPQVLRHDDDFYCTAASDGCVKTWKGESTAHWKTVENGRSVIAGMCWLNKGNALAVASMDRVINVYEVCSPRGGGGGRSAKD